MKRWRGLFFVTVMLASFAGVAFAALEIGEHSGIRTFSGSKWAEGEILVKFKQGVSEETIRAINKGHESRVIAFSHRGGYYRLGLAPGRSVAQMAKAYGSNPNVAYAEPNHFVQALGAPNDPFYTYQWHLDNPVYGGIHMEQAWDLLSEGSSQVRVAVIDTGVAFEDYGPYRQAPDLQQTSFLILPESDYVEKDGHPNDDHGHGTHVTGTVAQSTNNAMGVAGIAHGVTILPIKVIGADGTGLDSDVADAVRLAADHADVINLSLGSPDYSQTMEDAIRYAYQQGVTVVCAAGNEGWLFNTPSYPAVFDECIAVGATTYQETLAFYSNTGSYLDLAAPGGVDNSLVPLVDPDVNDDGYIDAVLQQTFTDDPTSFTYLFLAGTSMAAPHVSGLAAMLLSRGAADGLVGAERPARIREILVATAKDLGLPGWDEEFGHGLINAAAALAYTASPPPPPPPPPPEDNQPPVALFADLADAVDGDGDGAETVILDGSPSYDSDGEIVQYDWREGEAFLGSEMVLSATFAPGTHNVSLSVTDDDGATAFGEGSLRVIDKVVITRAKYDNRKGVLQVEATSSAPAPAQLTLYDDKGVLYGEMSFDGRKYVYKQSEPVKPAGVLVGSEYGGTDTRSLEESTTGGGKGRKNK